MTVATIAHPVSDNLKARVDNLYAHYADTICDGDIEAWPDFFTDDCLYHVKPRSNHERGMMLGPIFSESKGALIDRVTAIRNSMVFAPRAMCYVVGSIRVVETDGETARTRSMFSAYHTLDDGDSHLLMVARSFDHLALGTELKFIERVVIFDTERVPGALIYPV
jgi:3-phenylpropionate/cinnamic acid dioxygenase small subunit